MNFCNKCDNMFYITIYDDSAQEEINQSKLIYYCKNCGNKDTTLDQHNICVSKTTISKKNQSIIGNINEYTKHDPTLPRINTIKCPNSNCSTNSNTNPTEREIIYIRVDDINKKYIYLCSTCDFTWNLNNK